ncbi:MAG: hypothetical protein KJ070_14495 [Verrucomicrobia bacterium]|nr:hypothetical protein [Verrucomicrobiota bacterium]
MRATPILGWVVLGGIVAALVVIPLWQRRVDPYKKPEFGEASPISIDLEIRGEQIAQLNNSADLMAVLRAGRHTRQHECSYQGKLILYYEDGTTVEARLRPGHKDAYYEFSCANGLFAVPRPAFMSALAAAGVDTNQMPTK